MSKTPPPLHLNPGERVIFLDERQFGHNKVLKTVFLNIVRDALKELGIDDKWDVRWATLPVGDWMVAVGIDPDPQDPDESSLFIVAIGEEKDRVDDFLSSKTDDRFFGPGNEIERLSQAGADRDQYIFAYPAWLPKEEYGILDSLWDDYRPMFYAITDPVKYAYFIAKFAARYGQPRSPKSGSLMKKRVSLEQGRENALAYYFTRKVAKIFREIFETNEAALAPLKEVTFTPKGNPRMPEVYRKLKDTGVLTGFDTKGLKRAWLLYCGKETDS